MRRSRVVVHLVTWLTVLTLLPVPWGVVATWLPASWPIWDSLGIARAEEYGNAFSQTRGPGAQNAPSTAFPPERVVLHQPGPVVTAPAQVRKPTFDFDESSSRGPGLAVRHQLPGEPLQNVEMRLRGVGGRQPQKSGRVTTFQVPRDGSGASPLTGAPTFPRVSQTPPGLTSGGGVTPGTGSSPVAAPAIFSATASATPSATASAPSTATATRPPVGSPSAQGAPAVDEESGWLGFFWRLFGPSTAHAQLFGTPFPTGTRTVTGSPAAATSTPTATPSPTAQAARAGALPSGSIFSAGTTPVVTATAVLAQAGTPTASSTATSTASPTRTPASTTLTVAPTATATPTSFARTVTQTALTATVTTTALASATSGATQTSTATPTPTASLAIPASPPAVSSPSAVASPVASPPALASTSGNAYGARLDLVYEQSADGTSMKETIVLHDRPQTNVLTYDIRLDGLKAIVRSDGGLNLVDHTGTAQFDIPAPTFNDATGRAGAASYRLAPGQLDIVLDQNFLSTGVLPFEVDPTITLLSASNLQAYAAAPWQRQTATARDGTQGLIYYNESENAIKIRWSSNHYQIHSEDVTIFNPSGQFGSLSVEVDPTTDRLYIAWTYMDSGSTSKLGLRSIQYDSSLKKWRPDLWVEVTPLTSSTATFNTPTIALGAGEIWIGFERQESSNYQYWMSHATVNGSTGATGSWSHETSPFANTSTVHYGSLVATTYRVVVVGRDSHTTGMAAVSWTFGSGWGSVAAISGQNYLAPEGNGKLYAWVNAPDPQYAGVITTLLTYAPRDYDANTQYPLSVFARPDGTGTWVAVVGVSPDATGTAPQIGWDGTTFYVFQRKSSGTNEWEIHGRRGLFDQGTGDWTWSAEPMRPWVVEASSADRNIVWFEVPRKIGGEMLPFYYLRDKASTSNDDLAITIEPIHVLGNRPNWEYREFVMPGAGTLKVNVANGNLFYHMTDALYPSRVWNDEITRTYNSADISAAQYMGRGWSSSFNPRIELTSDPNRVVYWAGDGSRYVYLKSGSDWVPELGMYAELTKPNISAQSVWRLKDVFGNSIYFDGNGRSTRKEDHKQYQSYVVWEYATPLPQNMVLTGSTGRTQLFTFDSNNRVENIHVTTHDTTSYDYDYTYDGQGRLQTATLVTNTSEFLGSDSGKRVRVTYGYDDAKFGQLNQITTPEGSVYKIGYDDYGRVAWVDLPDPTSGATSTCGLTSPAHCWQFAYTPGNNKTVITDPAGQLWTTLAYGSGQVYEIEDPDGNKVKRTWTTSGNLRTETDQLNNTTTYTYDTKGNRTKIADPLAGETTYTFDSNSRRTSRTDPRGNTTTYAYNADGLLTSETDPEGGVVQFAYNTTTTSPGYGDLLTTTNPRSKVTTFTYDLHGQVATESTPDGAQVKFTRDSWGRLVEKRICQTSCASSSASDRVTRTTYDGLSRVLTTRVRMGSNPDSDDASDLTSSMTYDRDGNVVTRTDPNGGVTTTTLDRRGRVIAIEAPPGNNQTGSQHRPCVATAYDQRGLVVGLRTAVTRTSGSSCTWSDTGITWNAVERVYDDRMLLTTERLVGLSSSEYAGSKIERTWTYDAAGRVLEAYDPEGRYEAYTYDALGRKLSAESAVTLEGVSGPGCHGISGAVCSKAEWVYDAVGNVVTEKIPTGSGSSQSQVTRTATYDKVQRLKTRTDELSRTWSYTYDANGNRLSETDPMSRVTTWTYDDGDRATSVDPPLVPASTTAYDAWDNVTSTTNAEGEVVSYQVDKAGRITQVTDPLNHTALLQYDKNGNRTALTDPRGNTQTVTYDALNRAIESQTAPATTTSGNVAVRTATATYALDGAVISETDFNAQTRSYAYDSARRLKTLDYPGSTPDVGYVWDKLGRRTSMAEGGSVVATYAYDEWGRLTAETRGSSVIGYRYDRRHQTRVAYPDGKTLTSTFDDAGQLTHLDDWRGSSTGRTAYTYDGAGRRTGRTLPNGVTTAWTFDDANRLTVLEHKQGSSGPTIFKATSTYDHVGRRLTQTDYEPGRITGVGFPLANVLPASRVSGGSGSPWYVPASRLTSGTPTPGPFPAVRTSILDTTTQTFTYDDAGRLTQETRTGYPTMSWTYDDAGNRLTETSGGTSTSYVYDDDNRLTSQTTGGVTTDYTYDANGSMVGRSKTGESLAYTWDAAARLTEIVRNSASQATFTYDGDGNRRTKSSGGLTTTYVNDARGLSQVLQATTGSTVVSYVPGIAQHDSSKATENQKWGYTLSDPQNARVLVDGAGTVAHRWEWEPFGKTRADGGSTAAVFSFGGEQKDDETGLVNLRARYYDPTIGRFLSRDSIPGVMSVPQSWNRYSYVENDPVNHVDPTGHKKKIKWPNGADPDDDSHAKKKQKACQNPGQYTGSCKGGPPNAAYAADGEAQHQAKKSGQASAAGNLAAAQAFLDSARHFASIAGTAAALTAARQAEASLNAARFAIQASHASDRAVSDSLSAPSLSLPEFAICGRFSANPWAFGTCVAVYHAGPRLLPVVLPYLEGPDLPQPPPEELLYDDNGLPIYFLDALRMPHIAMNTYDALEIDPSLAVLTYVGPKAKETDDNRKLACGHMKASYPDSCEEYPFATTFEGGRPEYTRLVPLREQLIQGGDLNNFYTYRAKLQRGDQFRVIVWFGEGWPP